MKFIFATLFSALLFSGAAFAANPLDGGSSPSSTTAVSFEQIDSNKDGMLSKSEAKKAAKVDFDKADVNRDGKLSRTEYEAAAASTGG